MKPLTPEQTLEIALRVHRTFEKPTNWFQGGWGRDDDRIALSFNQGLHILDEHGDARPPALGIRQPESRRCFCLATAIRTHTGAIASLDPANLSDHTEEIRKTYIEIGALHDHVRHENTFEPNLEAVVHWNDHPTRSFAEILGLTDAVIRHLDAEQYGLPSFHHRPTKH